MGSRARASASVGLLVLVLSACSPSGGADETTSSVTGGAIDLAVSKTCVPASGPECVPVNGEHVLIESEFVRAGVDEASAVAGSEGNDAVHLIFDDDGRAVLQSSTADVADAGESGRLLVKVGDRVLSAVRVPAPLEGDAAEIALPAGVGAEELVALIEAG